MDPASAALIREAYLDEDTLAAARRFRDSGEFAEVLRAVGGVQGKKAEELEAFPRLLLERKLGAMGRLAAGLPGMTWLVWRYLKRPLPGRLFTFLGRKL